MWLTAIYPIKHALGVAKPGDVFDGDASLISLGLASASLVAPPPAPVDASLSITAAQISDAGAGGVEVLKKGSVSEIRDLVSGARQFMPAWNRQNFPRRQSAAAPGFNLLTDRWHKSPPVDIDGLVAYWYAGYQHSTLGLQPIGNDLTVACAVMYPTASSPGAGKAFRRGGASTITVKDGEWVQSDPLSIYLPASTPIRLKSWVSPGAAGFVPYGTPCLGNTNGSLSGYGAQTDRSSYASGQADITQNSTNVTGNATNDTAYEPIVIARPAGYVRTWAIFADSRGYGAGEVGAGSGGTTVAGAGDAWGNCGMWERAIAIRGEMAQNLSISGSSLNTWQTDGFSSFLMMVGQSSCSSCVIALGTNDTLSFTAEQILANLQKMVNKARCLGFGEIEVPTLPPRTTSSNGYVDTAGQTIDAVRSARITTLNGYLRAGQLVGAKVIDQAALVQDATDPQKWRTDLGFVSTTDGVHESKDLIAWLAPQLAALM